MNTVEFEATVTEGVIEIPEKYRGRITDRVRVILLSEPPPGASGDIIDRLLTHPRRVEHFEPMTRRQIYERI